MGKKIISFSLWGQDPKYVVGAEENIKLQPTIYPGWICRYYIDESVPHNTVHFLETHGAEIVVKPRSRDFEGMFWRFEVMFDETVDYFIIRDCDSRLNHREADAVNEWIASGKLFHAMRDHKGHDIMVLGAMWGAKGCFLPDIEELYNWFIHRIEEAPVVKRGRFFYYDQVFLNQMIWPKVHDRALVHDDKKRFTGTEKPFRVTLPVGRFVGQQYGPDNNPLAVPL